MKQMNAKWVAVLLSCVLFMGSIASSQEVKTTRYCQALDLKDDPQLIKEYEAYHQKIWPEVAQHIRDVGIEDMEIWRIGNRLFMIMEVNETFDPKRSSEIAAKNPKNQEWEDMMWEKYQVATPWAKNGERWVNMDKVFDFKQQ